MFKKIILSILLLCSTLTYSQSDLDIYYGKNILKEYIRPIADGFSAGLNNGWYNTAKPHKFGGFDITIASNIVLIPESYRMFSISEIGGNSFSGGETPTIVGEKEPSEITYNSNSVKMPPGLNIPVFPVPIVQAGIGLIKGTEINIRYLPKINVGKVDQNLYGLGLKHDLLQWIPGGKILPISLSIQGGYTKFNSTVVIENVIGDRNNELAFDVEAMTANIILSKKILMFTPYASLGYNSSKSSFKIDGDYAVGALELNAEELTNIEYESNTEIRANLGFRFNIAILALQANYTISKYPVATLGAGISFR
tara:strand:- start:2717 stop:3646 length:930 start_codon:yes stop_codon:yes gene_type:complete